MCLMWFLGRFKAYLFHGVSVPAFSLLYLIEREAAATETPRNPLK